MQKITLLLGIHCHQPIGNFGWVIEEGYQKAYLPFIETLARHPKIKIALHYSGSLLEWIEENHPEFFDKIATLVKRGQVEVMTGGFYEPILAIIPKRDRLGQISRLSDYVKGHFSFTPRGLWLAERVWEPALPETLKEAGVSYTIVDDFHFGEKRGKGGDVYDYYITEEDGNTVFIFSSSRTLRYTIPFKEPDITLECLKDAARAGAGCITFADDGEKFGLWPGTHQWVYRDGWLERFFTALERNDSWVTTTTFNEYIQTTPPRGLVYFPCASYEEMMEWSGGYFRNFLTKYPESNHMHKRMLHISEKLHELSNGKEKTDKGAGKRAKDLAAARRFLYRGQVNCPYWHGVFGGLYLNHLRNGVFTNLIEAEKIVDAYTKEGPCSVESVDYDKDGNNEIVLQNDTIKLFVDPLQGGAIQEVDYWPTSTNVTNTLTRRYEKYHDKLFELAEKKMREGAGPSQETKQADGIPSIHEMLGTKDVDLTKKLLYDSYRRSCLIDHFFKTTSSLDDFSGGTIDGIGDFIERPYSSELIRGEKGCGVQCERKGFLRKEGFQYPVGLKKSISLSPKKPVICLDYEIYNDGEREFSSRFGVEFNFSIMNSELKQKGAREASNECSIQDDWNKLDLTFAFDKGAQLWHFPIETVSESEGGIEKIEQGSALLFWWVIRIPPAGTWKMHAELSVKASKKEGA
ncbi:MAG: DUF1926 domain-containing protein [Candidatus Omnitrophica bacterium]|nr:DUF1926 domain-containing protein [Candidatus Omnitrophota bacterium]